MEKAKCGERAKCRRSYSREASRGFNFSLEVGLFFCLTAFVFSVRGNTSRTSIRPTAVSITGLSFA